ncbi:MAG: response regulator [Cyclobacteriaceae bacterium]
MSLRLAKFLVIFLIFGVIQSTAQSDAIKFYNIGLESGLSNSSVSKIYQDTLGYLWVGTEDGLNRYDGYNFKIYSAFEPKESKSRISNSRICSIVEDRKGDLWIATYDGLNRYDRLKDRFETFRPSQKGVIRPKIDVIYCLLIDSKGVFWIGTEDGLLIFDPQNQTFEKYKNFLDDSKPERITCIEEYNGVVFVGTDQGLFSINQSGTVKNLSKLGLTSEQRIVCLMVDDYERLWVGHFSTGISVIERSMDEAIFYSHNPSNGASLANNYVYDISKSKEGEIWIATDNGLSRYIDKSRFKNYFSEQGDDYSLTSDIIRDLYFDQGDRMWVATRLGGICYYDQALDQFNHIKRHSLNSNDLSSNKIAGFAETKFGELVVATDGGGVNIYNETENTFRRITEETSNISSNKTLSLLYDNRHGLWIGTWKSGLNYYDLKTGKVQQYSHDPNDPHSLSDDNIYEIYEDENGVIWIGTWGNGLSRYRPETNDFQNFTNNPDDPFSFAGSAINQITSDGKGNLYVATELHGLEKFNIASGKFTHYKSDGKEGSLSIDVLISVFIDSRDKIWVGTNGGGLNLFDSNTGSFSQFGMNNGLPSNVIQGILEDKSGHIWLSTNQGLSMLNPSSMEFKNYSKTDGLQDYQFMPRNAYQCLDGRLAFGGNNGFNYFSPEKLKDNTVPPSTYITDIKLFYKPIPIDDDESQILNKHITFVDKVILKSDENFFSLEYTAMNFTHSAKNQYTYKMDGLHDEWIQAGTDRTVSFTALRPGRYTFRVKGSNNDGVWNEIPTSLDIIILPPWWQTQWALICYAVVIALILIAFRGLIIARTTYINDLKVERLEKENLEKLNKSKLQFFTNISHEFRTPLTLIMGPLENLLQSGEGGKFFKEQLSMININSQRLMRLINQLLDFRKIESNNIQLQAADGNIVKFIKEIKLSFESLAQEKQIDLQFHASSNVINLFFDRDQFEKILFNLLSNAFKNTSSRGKISIQLIDQEDNIQITVEDSGKGIETEHFDKIFERFYSDDKGSIGTGIGLALTKSLVELHHGVIEVESEINAYTRFKLTFKKGSEHLEPEEIMSDFQDSEFHGHYQPEGNVSFTSDDESGDRKSLEEMDKILIVEDNEEVRIYLKSILRRDYVVLEAENGKEGWEIATEEVPDLVISDVMMPVLDGIAFCKKMKTSTSTSHIPVILLTARTSLIFKVEGLELGADDYITKPFNTQVLLLKIKNLLKSKEHLKKYFLNNELLEIEPKMLSRTSVDEKFMEMALNSVEINMSNSEYSVEELGRDVSLSRMQLYRKLKTLTGQSANGFIRNIKLKKAAQLLAQGDHSVSEVTYEVGFSDLQYFRTCFKKQFGINPSEYSKKMPD